MDLLEELKDLTRILNKKGIDYALCGGLAIAVYAKLRATLDIDIMIAPDFVSRAKDAAQELGYAMSAMPMEFKGGAVKMHRLTKIDKDSGEHLVLDFLIVTPETRKAWDERLAIEWEGGTLNVVSPQGLILLKSLRGSGQDRDDIEYLRSLEDEN